MAANVRGLVFYAQALQVARFVAEHAGARSLARLADQFARRQSTAQALATLSGLPREVPALEAAWVGWMARDASHR
jgi:hypothetical protein